jgi:hypothetical protein
MQEKLMTQPPLPQPQLKPTGITPEQDDAYTLQRLELCDGFYNYGGQDVKGFHLAVLTNMGLREVVQNVPLSLLLEAIEEVVLQNSKLNLDTATGEAMLNRFNRGLEELKVVAEYLEEKS